MTQCVELVAEIEVIFFCLKVIVYEFDCLLLSHVLVNVIWRSLDLLGVDFEPFPPLFDSQLDYFRDDSFKLVKANLRLRNHLLFDLP